MAGVVIVIVSAIVNSLDLQLSEPTDVDKIDSTQYKVGEKAETLFGGITMTDIQTGAFSLESMTSSYDAPKEYKFDFMLKIPPTMISQYLLMILMLPSRTAV